MKQTLLLFSLFASVGAQAQINFKKAVPFAKTITAADLKKHLTIVAGPEMEGRETATEGQRKAAAYIEAQMKAIGLQPGNNGSYQMVFPVYRDSLAAATITVNEVPLQINQQFNAYPSNHTAVQNFSEVVYINFEDTLWTKSKLDISGKLVLFSMQKTAGRRNTLAGRIAAVQAKGAAAALVIHDGFPLAKPAETLDRMENKKFASKQTINYYSVAAKVAQDILKADWTEDTSAVKTMACKTYKADIGLSSTISQQLLQSTNVMGFLEGTDKKDEYLVLTGHYDHMGKKDSLIWYGADDDGSGTVSVLEMAEAFVAAKKAGKGPRRSVLFMTVSGEEKGLWGSEYYSEHPVYPLDKTTANLNADMVGRTDSIHIKSDTLDYIYVVGEDKISTDLKTITDAANKMTKLYLDPKYNDPKDRERIYYRSDHYNFAKKGVPIIFYFDGINVDYHKVTDTVDKIQFDKMETRVHLIFYTAWEMANRNQMLVRDKPLPEGKR
jgi:hypothetical protein